MINRELWLSRIAHAWTQVPIAWLAGVRRSGKTVLARQLPDVEFVNCDLPGEVSRLHDPEAFFRSVRKSCIVFDEVHQLQDPSRLLKIAADAFPHLRILATGSSTLAATRKFRDSLTGRKRTIPLTPVLAAELPAFGIADVTQRLLRGGLPPALLAETPSWEFYAEWLDSFFARDVQELFRVEKRAAFLKLAELLFRQSGGLLEYSSLAKHAGISRPTVMNWIEVLQVTQAVRIIRPFSHGGKRELLAQPKVYAFDTGFICYTRGWDQLRPTDCGTLWENLVLDTLLAAPVPRVHFWRDKSQREVDFVVPGSRDRVDAIECKWNPDAFEPDNLVAFRLNYPSGRNYVVCPNLLTPYTRRMKNMTVEFTSAPLLAKEYPTGS